MILVGNAVSVVGLVAFGIAPSYGVAAAARAVAGALNGIIGWVPPLPSRGQG